MLQDRVGHGVRFEIGLAHSDVFIYFSHARLSPPPRAWITAAHRAGVRALGTLCTEWADGELANDVLAWDGGRSDSSGALARGMAAFAHYFGFDGWLINIETALILDSLTAVTENLISFVRLLTNETRLYRGGLILWYDSVDARNGSINWASALDLQSNQPFFDVTDGIFLDYHWDLQRLDKTVRNAGIRARDVCVGIDVWGRGMMGGGGWRGGEAASAATARGLSVALFAPAWTYEERGGMESLAAARETEERLWHGRESTTITTTTTTTNLATMLTLFDDACITNASGLSLDPTLAAALSDVSRSAAAAAMCVGWNIKEARGDGMIVLRDEAWKFRDKKQSIENVIYHHHRHHHDDNNAIESNSNTTNTILFDLLNEDENDDSVSCFATSYGWCSASQIVPLKQNNSSSSNDVQQQICISEWIRGGPPNTADPYELSIQLLDAEGKGIGGGDMITCGKRYATEQWQRILLLVTIPPSIQVNSILVTHGGQDAEGWAGHFGVRMRALRVRVLHHASSAAAAAAAASSGMSSHTKTILAPSLSEAINGPRSSGSSLPVVTHFDVGIGKKKWHCGVIAEHAPWFDISMSQRLPPRLGQYAVVAVTTMMTLVELSTLPKPSLSLGIAVDTDHSSSSRVPTTTTTTTNNNNAVSSADLSHACAWMGGTSLLLSVPHCVYTMRDKSTPTTVAEIFEILSFSLVSTSSPLCVTLITQASYGTWAVPLLVLTDGTQIIPINGFEGGRVSEEGWVTVKWEFASSTLIAITSLRIAVCHTNNNNKDENRVSDGGLWVRVGCVEIA